jgi:hypothetical protein
MAAEEIDGRYNDLHDGGNGCKKAHRNLVLPYHLGTDEITAKFDCARLSEIMDGIVVRLMYGALSGYVAITGDDSFYDLEEVARFEKGYQTDGKDCQGREGLAIEKDIELLLAPYILAMP